MVATLDDRVDAGKRLAPSLWLACYLALALALLVPLWRLGLWMLDMPYYEHVPVLAIVAFGLAVLRLRRFRANAEGVEISPETNVGAVLFLVLAGITLCAVYILPSRWFAAPSLLFGLISLVFFCGGRRFFQIVRGPLLLLLACVPLPVQMDNWFVLELQRLATWVASIWLDLAGVLHLATGVDIRTATSSYVVEDACSGIHSIFAAIAVSMGYCVIREYRLRRVAVVVLVTVFWVTVANALRVFLIVFLQSRWEVELAEGVPHFWLGVATFGVGLLLSLSTDRFIQYLWPIATEQKDNVEVDTVEIEGGVLGRLLAMPVSARLAKGVFVVITIGGVVSIFAFSSFSRLGAARRSIDELAATSYIDFDGMKKEALPERVGNWAQQAFEVRDMREDSIFGGMRSFVWQYTNGTRTVLVSVDGPYHDWHDLSWCYTAAAWEIQTRRVFTIEDSNGEEFEAADLRLSRPPFETAQVLFLCLAPDGACVAPPPHFGDAFVHLINRLRWAVGEKEDFGGGVIQIQLLDQTPVQLSVAQQQDNQQLFSAVARELLTSRRRDVVK